MKSNSFFIHRNRRSGFTIFEMLIAGAIFAVLLFAIYQLVRFTRLQIGRGQWLVFQANELRNTALIITKKGNNASYPSKIERNDSVVTTFQERRIYDTATGRVADVQIRPSSQVEPMNVRSVRGTIRPAPNRIQRILDFPVCSPQIGNNPGRIEWVVVNLVTDSITGLGEIQLLTGEETYRTNDIFRFTPSYNLPTRKRNDPPSIIENRILVSDVLEIEVDYVSVLEPRGKITDASGNVTELFRNKSMIIVSVTCAYPEEHEFTLTEIFTIVNPLEISDVDIN